MKRASVLKSSNLKRHGLISIQSIRNFIICSDPHLPNIKSRPRKRETGSLITQEGIKSDKQT